MESILERLTTHYGLTEKRAQLAIEYCQRGTLQAAAKAVPYDYREAKRLLTESPSFQAAINEYIQGLYIQDRVRARNTALHLLENAESEKVRLDAAKWIDERAAGKAAEHHIHEHRHTLARPELIERINKLSKELQLGETIEGEFEEVAPETIEEKSSARPPLPD